MKISLRRSGGFTGPAGAVTYHVDLHELPSEPRQQLQALVDAAHVFDRRAEMLLTSPRPWDMQYVLEVDDPEHGRTQRIKLHLDAVDDSLRALVDRIEEECAPSS